MRKGCLIVLVMLLAAACHYSDDGNIVDSVPLQLDSANVSDMASTERLDTGDTQTSRVDYQLRRDSAEITNLRIFARKQRVIYSSALLLGEWVRGSEHEEYMGDGTGRRWNVAEDVSLDEAMSFRWSLDSNLLTITYKMKMGGMVPKYYLVTFVDDENLAYKDAYDEAYLLDKVSTTSVNE